MEKAFSSIVNMSLTGSLVILLVLAARWCLRRQPKIFSYALWAVVLFRLLCPVSISAPVSALEVASPQVEQTSQAVSRVSYVAAEPEPLPAGDLTPVPPAVEGKKILSPMALAAWVWLAGVGVMACHSFLSFGRLRRRLVGVTPLDGNIFLSDYVESPFVLGVIRPRIYLPTSTPVEERSFIVAHEAHHIQRLDHIWKCLAFLALCIHWFNPLVWLSFLLAGQDMEMSCDEAVIRKLGEHTRADYAQALLRLSTKRTVIRGTPLAFGEGDTKGRVINMANWKKPKVWASLLCAAVCVALLVACAVNPREEIQTEPKYVPDEDIHVTMNVPEGYTYDPNSMYITRDSDGKLVGGLDIYQIPEGVYDPEDKWFDWLYKVGIPDLEADLAGELYCEGGITGFSSEKMWIMEFTNNSADAEKKTVHRRHYFYVANDHVYDVWEDDLAVDSNTFDSVLRFTEVKTDGTAEAPQPMGDNMYRQSVESPLPDGYVFINEEIMTDEESMKTSDQPHCVVGGLTRYDIPDTVDWTDATFAFLAELGIPDVDDPSLAKIGGSDSHCDWLLEVSSDVPEGQPQTVHRYHEFTVLVDEEGHATLMDVWFDATQIDYSEFAGFLSFPYLQAPEEDAGEDEIFDLCMEVVANVGAADYHLHSEVQGPDGATTIVDSYKMRDGDCLHIEQVDGTSQEALLVVGDSYFYGTGAIGGEITWQAITLEEYSNLHMQWFWLGSHPLSENRGTAYMGTLVEEEGPLHVYKISECYTASRWGTVEDAKSYEVGFQFDGEGNFLRVNISANTGTEKEVFVKESIVSLDEATVRAAIDREYLRAQGHHYEQSYQQQRTHHPENEKKHH